jgi:hypothetical protein
MRYLRPDGTAVWVHNSVSALIDQSGWKSASANGRKSKGACFWENSIIASKPFLQWFLPSPL